MTFQERETPASASIKKDLFLVLFSFFLFLCVALRGASKRGVLDQPVIHPLINGGDVGEPTLCGSVVPILVSRPFIYRSSHEESKAPSLPTNFG